MSAHLRPRPTLLNNGAILRLGNLRLLTSLGLNFPRLSRRLSDDFVTRSCSASNSLASAARMRLKRNETYGSKRRPRSCQ